MFNPQSGCLHLPFRKIVDFKALHRELNRMNAPSAKDARSRLALFNLAIDSRLRGCNVVAVRVDDVAPSGYNSDLATVRLEKTGRLVRFEMTEQTRQAIDEYLRM